MLPGGVLGIHSRVIFSGELRRISPLAKILEDRLQVHS